MKVEDLIEKLKQRYPTGTTLATTIWVSDDIEYVFEELYEKELEKGEIIPLTEAESAKILDSIEDGFDANEGINWDVIRAAVRRFVSKR